MCKLREGGLRKCSQLMEGLIQLEAIFATILKAQLGIHQLVNMKILISITNYLKLIKQSKK